MLSEKAFNALLKTLEEPPEHVKFIFATTEVRKVPVTVLSRCQRFDLRRIEAAALETHLARIAGQEQVQATPGALRLLARAADGSVRDALSLLDQAIAHGAGVVEEQAVREMLGLADRAVCLDLLDHVLRGDVGEALAVLGEQYACGADPLAIIEDLLELTHWLTRLKLTPLAGARGRRRRTSARHAMAEQLSMGGAGTHLADAVEGPGRDADGAVAAARGRDAGDPDGLCLRSALAGRCAGGVCDRRTAAAVAARRRMQPRLGPSAPSAAAPDLVSRRQPAPPPARAEAVQAAAHPVPSPHPRRRDGAALVCRGGRAGSPAPRGLLCGYLETGVHLVRFEPGHIELRLAEDAPADLPHRLSRWLGEATGRRWMVGLSREGGEPTLLQQRESAQLARLDEAAQHPLVRSILQAFPGATIDRVRGDDAPAPADPDDDALVTADADGNAPAGRIWTRKAEGEGRGVGTEIERKFLVVERIWRAAATGTEIRQGYVYAGGKLVRCASASPEIGDISRSRQSRNGVSRKEYEYDIPLGRCAGDAGDDVRWAADREDALLADRRRTGLGGG